MKKSSHRCIVNFYFIRMKQQQQINTELCNITANLQFITY